MDMLNTMSPVALCVLGLLVLASLYSWMVIFGKMGSFGKATNESRKFLRAFRKAERLNEISALAETYKASPLAQVFEEVYETYKRQTGGSGPPRNITALERSAQTAANESVTNLERRMTWLATIAAISPICRFLWNRDGSRLKHFTGSARPESATLARGCAGHQLTL